MTKHRERRRNATTPPRIAAPRIEPAWPAERAVTRQAPIVERLAYTRSQAAEALGVSRSTFIRRVLPYVDTVEMPWGAKLIPVDELERLLAERRRAAEPRPAPTARGRPPLVPAEVIERIRTERAEGASLAPDRGRPQRRPDPNRPRRRTVVALDHSLRARPLRSACIRRTASPAGGPPASDVITPQVHRSHIRMAHPVRPRGRSRTASHLGIDQVSSTSDFTRSRSLRTGGSLLDDRNSRY